MAIFPALQKLTHMHICPYTLDGASWIFFWTFYRALLMKMMKVMTMTMIRFTISDVDSVCVRRPCDVIYFLKGMSHTK